MVGNIGVTGLVRAILCLVTAATFVSAGSSMGTAARYMDIRSVGGQTLEEAFYQAYAFLAAGLSTMCYAFAVAALVLAIPRRS